jgi:hypothetical protein
MGFLLRKSPGNCDRNNHNPPATAAAQVNEPSARAATSALRLPSSGTPRITA